MSDPDITNQTRDLRTIEHDNALYTIEKVREILRRSGKRLCDTGSCLVEADAEDLITIARELTTLAANCRTLAVELNGATALVAEHVAEMARFRGIEL